jgi:hypothetical protein
MTDMLSEVRAPLVQAPIAWVARSLLASDASVRAVMVLGDDGKILAHERALGEDEFDSLEGQDHPLLFYASGPRLLFFVRLNEEPTGKEISDRIMATIKSPSFSITS